MRELYIVYWVAPVDPTLTMIRGPSDVEINSLDDTNIVTWLSGQAQRRQLCGPSFLLLDAYE